MSNETKIIGGVVVGLVACCCLIALAMMVLGGLFVFQTGRVLSTEIGPFMTEVGPVLTEAFIEATPTPRPIIITTPVPTPLPGADDTLKTLEEALIPASNLRELAVRLKGIPDIPEVVSTTPTEYAIGDELEFNVSNANTNRQFKVTARLIYKTDNAYFFAEDSVDVDKADVQKLLDTFQKDIYPTDREFFGNEWSPGVDGDPHVYILYVRGLGSTVGGYYSSADEYSHLANEYSNEKEMFYINADATYPAETYFYSTLAHEFQHMIHWYHDGNEESWMNEGSSVLAELLNGYGSGGTEFAFTTDPDLQLTTWSSPNSPDFGNHYGAAFLFMTYFLDRFGSETTQALVADPANGLRAVDDVLAQENVTDPLTGKPITSIDVFADWVMANYLGDPDVGDGRYAYNNYSEAITVSDPTDSFSSCPISESATVHQFAADYYQIKCQGNITIDFTGSQQVRVIPAMPHGGRYAFWGHRNDESDTRLTREFDLTGVSSANLKYWMWAQIEKNFDYVYLIVSADDGKTWEMVETPSGTDADPVGNNLGWGYTGNSGGGDPENGDPSDWIEETVDLSQYAGQKILVRFEYVTDAALNYAGFMIDDISIPELNYVADFEKDDGGWEDEGFVRMDNFLPQKFVVQAIIYGAETRVERLPLSEANTGTLTVELGAGDRVVLVVSGITPFTTELASYEFEVK